MNELFMVFVMVAFGATLALCKPTTPNFLILFADDMGYGDLSFNGHPTIHTPNLDKLAYEGMRFTQWYSAFHVCSPSRAAMLTGRLPVRSGMSGTWSGGVLTADAIGGLPLNETTFAEALKDVGYMTKCIGKWHLGQRHEFLPYFQGFDEYFGIPYSVDMGYSVWDNGNTVDVLPLLDNTTIVEQPADLSKLSEKYAQHAIDFISNATAQGSNWVLYFPFNHVHVPDFTNEQHCNTSIRGRFGDAIEELDWTVGQVFNYINDDNNSVDPSSILTFFTSDNGPWLIEKLAGGSAGLFRDGKTTTWEGGVREPAFVHWPDHIAPLSRTMEIGHTCDIFTTILTLANASIPNDRVIDGKDLTDVLLNNGTSPHECIYIYGGTPGADCSNSTDPINDCPGLYAVRCGSYKAHWVTKTANTSSDPVKQNPPLLYNIDWDPSEKHPIYPNNIIYNSTIEYLTSMRDKYEATVPNGIPNQNLKGSSTEYTLCCDGNSTAKYPQYPNCTCNPENWSAFTCQPTCMDKDSCGSDNVLVQRFAGRVRINRDNGNYIIINEEDPHSKQYNIYFDNDKDEIKRYYYGNEIGFDEKMLDDNNANKHIIQSRNEMLKNMQDDVNWIWYDGQWFEMSKYRM